MHVSLLLDVLLRGYVVTGLIGLLSAGVKSAHLSPSPLIATLSTLTLGGGKGCPVAIRTTRGGLYDPVNRTFHNTTHAILISMMPHSTDLTDSEHHNLFMPVLSKNICPFRHLHYMYMF